MCIITVAVPIACMHPPVYCMGKCVYAVSIMVMFRFCVEFETQFPHSWWSVEGVYEVGMSFAVQIGYSG